MGFKHLDRHAGRSSWLTEHTTPAQRLWIAIAAAFVAGLMPRGAWRALAMLAFASLLGAWLARVPPRTMIKRLAQALPFFLLPALALPVTVPGPSIGEIGPFTITEPGVQRALEIIVRATLAVSAVSILISVTRATDLLGAIDRLPLPHLVKHSLALGYRYLYLLTDEFERTGQALKSRAGHAPAFRAWRARAATMSHLFVRAHARGTRIHAAMLSRGYRGDLPGLESTARANPAWTATIVLLLAALWVAGYLEAKG